MKKEKIYVVVEDLQGDTFKVGFTGTANMFRETFLTYTEGHDDARDKLNSLEEQKIIDFIADYWELKIEETTLEKII